MLKNALQQKCPRCRHGELFESKTYDLKHFSKMHDHCQCCGQPFELEPSFYDGAMYVSYALQVAIFVSVIVAYKVLYPPAGVFTYIATTAGIVVTLLPLTYRLSRSLWIHFFVKYDKHQLNLHCNE